MKGFMKKFFTSRVAKGEKKKLKTARGIRFGIPTITNAADKGLSCPENP